MLALCRDAGRRTSSSKWSTGVSGWETAGLGPAGLGRPSGGCGDSPTIVRCVLSVYGLAGFLSTACCAFVTVSGARNAEKLSAGAVDHENSVVRELRPEHIPPRDAAAHPAQLQRRASGSSSSPVQARPTATSARAGRRRWRASSSATRRPAGSRPAPGTCARPSPALSVARLLNAQGPMITHDAPGFSSRLRLANSPLPLAPPTRPPRAARGFRISGTTNSLCAAGGRGILWGERSATTAGEGGPEMTAAAGRQHAGRPLMAPSPVARVHPGDP